MKSSFMFGHADAPNHIMSKLEDAVEYVYSECGVTAFYVGNRGRFDSMAASAVKRAKMRYNDIKLFLLLAYHPAERPVDLWDGFDGSYYPPLEGTPRQYSIVKANRYMVNTADTMICYVCHIGSSGKLLEYAQRRKKDGIHIVNTLAM